ncbi:MAG: hypothetical protein C0626_00025 [Arcobacter sp.]|uniref:hypothetical protein n=1 Tax=uncultured Arcobacter sp. TaxID=165434 RepID=UPI000CA6DC0A|nr:hypothetical protein [uncultured Arcobacter sp.]PLY11000.1 MAG: hypothetical protein C0626_00025 [Arcobacter sp.]
MQYKLNSGFEKFEPFIKNIQSHFKQINGNIHKARNELKILNWNDTSVVVKSFKVPHFINKIVYTFFKDTKAKKSYDYSIKIGDFTPTPIAYVTFYKGGLLNESYFISEEFKYDFTIREPLLEENFEDKEEVFKQFAQFTYSLHENGILHQDYSPGNILIKKEGSIYTFKIVDINRMQFISLSLEQRLKNFCKLWAKDKDLEIIATAYAKCIKEKEQMCVELALQYSQHHKNKINFKKRLKGIEVVD